MLVLVAVMYGPFNKDPPVYVNDPELSAVVLPSYMLPSSTLSEKTSTVQPGQVIPETLVEFTTVMVGAGIC
ncbi:MAG TPA: hypothetical protein VJ436_00640, partial [Anaerolineales bacterium]|nr:hypothetical protein [Anaerolineales bacterium]